MTGKANNLSNGVRFRQRQVFFARNKDITDLSDNEKEILDEINTVLGIDMLTCKRSLTYTFLYNLLQKNNNPDFCADKFPKQSAEWVVKRAVQDMNDYFAALLEFSVNPSKFTGKPCPPGYKKKGGHCTVSVSNQDCTIKVDNNGVSFACFPFKKKVPLCIGKPKGVLKQVEIVPVHDRYKIVFIFDVEIPDIEVSDEHKRIAAIDFGVDNLMAVTNNIGAECLLYKGNIIKSFNQYYNKKVSKIMSEEMNKPSCPKNRDGNPKFIPTEQYHNITIQRNNIIQDFMRKTACHFIAWCVEHRIDTIVLGVNKYWKQEVNMGHMNNQNFVQIPFAYLRSVISYKASEHGISIIEQEESYTSKASFLDNDPIPVYKEGDNTKHTFSGKRKPARYKGMYKKDGFRGLYISSDGTIINSDLNGSANILRKAIPDAFVNGIKPNFNKVIIIKNPDLEFVIMNQRVQVSKVRPFMSRSKKRRLEKKCA